MLIVLDMQPGELFEIQNANGEALVSGGKEIAKLFARFKPMDPARASREFPAFMRDLHIEGWRRVYYDIEPASASGVLRTAMEREASGNPA